MSTKITQGNVADGEGVGNVNPAMVRERAAQLAVADGRTVDEVTDADMEQAEKELRADLRSSDAQNAGPGEAPGREATHQSQSEALVEQGIEEAVHDEEVESGKRTLEGGD